VRETGEMENGGRQHHDTGNGDAHDGEQEMTTVDLSSSPRAPVRQHSAGRFGPRLVLSGRRGGSVASCWVFRECCLR
jgi:hypothetical protein